MQIHQIHVDGYGVWRDLSLEDVEQPVAVFHGENEAGKSTLMQFVRDMLYGLDGTASKYLPPADGGPAGGALSLVTATHAWRIEREWVWREGQWVESGQWKRRRGDAWEAASVPPDLRQTDRPTFENVYCLGLADLVALSQLDATAAGELLYSLSTGLDRVTLRDAAANLRRERRRLESPTDSPAYPVHATLQRSTRRCQETESTISEWLELDAALRKEADTGRELRDRLRDLSEYYALLEATQRTWESWQRLRELEEAHTQSPFGSRKQQRRLQRWRQLEGRRERWRRLYSEKRQAFRKLKQRIASIELHDAVAINRRLIEVLVDQQPRLVWLEAQCQATEGAQVTEALDTDEGGVTPEMFTFLERCALSLQTAREECDRLEAALVEQEPALPVENADVDAADIAERIRGAGDRVQALRRRVQLKQRLDKMVRHREELQQETEELLEQQVLPPRVLAYLGIPFVVGVMLVLAGVFWGTAAKLGWPVALLGLAGWVAAVVVKVILEKTAERELAEAEEQLSTLQRQIANARKESEQLDASLPVSTLSLEDRLAEAERQLEMLERESPAVRSGADRPPANIAERLDQAYARREQAELQWQQALRRSKLPPSTTPDQLADIPINTVSATRGVTHHDHAALRHEYEVLAGRIRRLAHECLTETANSSPVELLDRLHHALVTERRRRMKRRRYLREAKRIRSSAMKLRQRLRRLERLRTRLLRSFGPHGSVDRRRLEREWSNYESNRKELEVLRERIRGELGSSAAWEQAYSIAAECDAGELELRIRETRTQLEAVESEIELLHERRGEQKERQRQLAAQPVHDRNRLEQLRSESQLRNYTKRWASLALADSLLQQVQRRYEHERQPHTLRDASRYFHFLTGRQYDRVWTPWDRDCLLVETVAGEHRNLDELSTGTRELLFLALRLAIVAHFARHGTRLPLILDDVLVNLDRTRLKAACELLAAFADEGHQVLFFTCHDHVVQSFAEVGAAVVRLNARSTPTLLQPGVPLDRPADSGRAEATAVTASVEEVVDGDDWDEKWEELVEEGDTPQAEADEVEGEWEWVEDEGDAAAEIAEDDEDEVEGEYDDAFDEDAEEDVDYEDDDQEYEDEEYEDEECEDEFAEVDDLEAAEASDELDDVGGDNEEPETQKRFTWDSPERWQRRDEEAA